VKVSILALLALILSSLACQIRVGTPLVAPTVSPTAHPPTSTPSPAPARVTPSATAEAETVTIRAVVWVRAEPDGERIGSLETGNTVEMIGCDGSWCEIRTSELSGYVFRGCTDNNPDGLKCEAK
jgi:hypothetical protein